MACLLEGITFLVSITYLKIAIDSSGTAQVNSCACSNLNYLRAPAKYRQHTASIKHCIGQWICNLIDAYFAKQWRYVPLLVSNIPSLFSWNVLIRSLMYTTWQWCTISEEWYDLIDYFTLFIINYTPLEHMHEKSNFIQTGTQFSIVIVYCRIV